MRQFLLLGGVGMILLVPVLTPQPETRTVAAELAPTVEGAFQPLIMTSELVVGHNRLAFGLLKAHRLLDEATVVVRIYAIAEPEARLVSESQAPYYVLDLGESGSPGHHHPDGTRHVHRGDEDTAVRGFYRTQVTFPRPGPWGLEVAAHQESGATDMTRLTVTVLETSRTPTLGTAAPRSHNVIASDVQDLRQIDTSQPADPRLHQVRIVDAIAQGTPQVIVFATPQFCLSRMCGPVLEIVRRLLPVYGERVVFTHQEIWQDFAARQLFPTVEEWHLLSEPWIFVVDGAGIVRAKFEGLVTVREVEAAIQPLLPLGAPTRP